MRERRTLKFPVFERVLDYPGTSLKEAWMVTDQQIRRLLKLLQQERTLALAAAKAGMDEKTARKYLRIGKLPSQNQKTRWWRTREDLFKDVWPQIEEILEQDASVEAVTIFDYLSRT